MAHDDDYEDGNDRTYLVGHHTEEECRAGRRARKATRAMLRSLKVLEDYEVLEEAGLPPRLRDKPKDVPALRRWNPLQIEDADPEEK